MKMPEVSRNLMLTIEQISQLTGVRKSTLRYWERSFDNFLKPARTRSNRREYTLGDLERVTTIQRLIEQDHLTSRGVRLRLMELFAKGGEGSVRRKPKSGQVSGSPPA